jgi:hypothetical protein
MPAAGRPLPSCACCLHRHLLGAHPRTAGCVAAVTCAVMSTCWTCQAPRLEGQRDTTSRMPASALMLPQSLRTPLWIPTSLDRSILPPLAAADSTRFCTPPSQEGLARPGSSRPAWQCPCQRANARCSNRCSSSPPLVASTAAAHIAEAPPLTAAAVTLPLSCLYIRPWHTAGDDQGPQPAAAVMPGV